MNKSFQKTLIAAALVAGSFAAVAGTPGTTNLLFPYVTTQTGAFTFISIAQQGGTSATTAQPLHFTYTTKAISAANTSLCDHLDGDAASTANDLMQFEISNRINVPAAFGDTTSVPKYFPGTAAAANRHGFLSVNNDAAGAYGSGAAYAGANLYGEARIINTATGLAAGYSTDDLHTTSSGANPDFGALGGPDGGAANSTKVISWFQEPTVSATFYILPLDTEQNMAFQGNVTANYQVEGVNAGVLGHYNNNEQFQSSTARAPVTCLGLVSRSDLLGPLNAPFSDNGGWGNFVNQVPTGGTARNSLVYKYETTGALGGSVSFINRAPVK